MTSPTAFRWAAFGLGLLAFALRAAEKMLPLRPTYTTAPVGIVGYVVIVGLIVVGIPFGVFALLARRARRAAGFVRRDGRLVVEASPVAAGTQAVLLMSLAGGFAPSPMGSRGIPANLLLVATLPMGIFVGAAIAILLVRRPEVELDPEGLTIRRLRRETRLGWDDLLPGGPLPPTRRWPRQLRLHLNAPGPFDDMLSSEDVPVGWLHIDATSLADTIRHYVDHPELRPTLAR
ncbi:hypothetical protein GCM10009682_37920 [Luedemannella flava]|uniref:Low molecular weight protein antigen 6 PH domain-containing protein n=1 Tax=Luedemannella flava TaxID=349316 RepID=A0ABN2M7D1_9ACTN